MELREKVKKKKKKVEMEEYAALRRGEREALETVYHDYCAKVQTVVYRIVYDTEAAETLTRRVFKKLWEEKPEADTPRLWIFTKAYRMATEYRRKLPKEKQPGPATVLPGAYKISEKPNIDFLVETEMLRLDADSREILSLCLVGGLSQRQTAELKGIPYRKTVQMYERALTRIRREINGGGNTWSKYSNRLR